MILVIADQNKYDNFHSNKNRIYRLDFGFKIIGSSVAVMVFLGLLTIAPQSIKAAVANPINSLRNE